MEGMLEGWVDSEVLISHGGTLVSVLKARGSCGPLLTRGSQLSSPGMFCVLASRPSLSQIPAINIGEIIYLGSHF